MDTHSWRDKANYFDFQGHQIAYWTGGKEDAKPLLLVHGFPTWPASRKGGNLRRCASRRPRVFSLTSVRLPQPAFLCAISE